LYTVRLNKTKREIQERNLKKLIDPEEAELIDFEKLPEVSKSSSCCWSTAE
jgi:hypothetical protein